MRSSRHFNTNWALLNQDLFFDTQLVPLQTLGKREDEHVLTRNYACPNVPELKITTLKAKEMTEEFYAKNPEFLLNLAQTNVIVEEEKEDGEEVASQKGMPFSFEILTEHLVSFLVLELLQFSQ